MDFPINIKYGPDTEIRCIEDAELNRVAGLKEVIRLVSLGREAGPKSRGAKANNGRTLTA